MACLVVLLGRYPLKKYRRCL